MNSFIRFVCGRVYALKMRQKNISHVCMLRNVSCHHFYVTATTFTSTTEKRALIIIIIIDALIMHIAYAQKKERKQKPRRMQTGTRRHTLSRHVSH